jgi:hypothetical protein
MPFRVDDDSATPPGASTPRPDPTDKRLPGILHSYFGQVRDSLIPRRRSSVVNPSPAIAPSTVADRSKGTSTASKEKETGSSRLHSNTLPSPTPSTSSRRPSTSQLNGVTEKLTQGACAPPQNQATPPQTPRTRSQEGRPPTSNLSQTSLASSARSNESRTPSNSRAPSLGPPKGKLTVSITEGRGLRPSVDPYVVCQFQWAEYISEGPKHGAAKKDERSAAGLAIQRTESHDPGRPMAIPMKSRQSSNNGVSSDPREDGTFDEITDPKWEHETVLYVHCH